MATKKKNASQEDATLQHSAPVMLRSGMLMMLTSFKICEDSDKDFKEEVRSVLDELKNLISDPETIERFRKVLKL